MGSKLLRLRRVLVIVLAIGLLSLRPAYGEVRVFVAASLADLIVEIGERFTAETGVNVITSTAGSSTLARQIMAGAPADIFVSANPDLIAQVQNHAGFGSGVSLFYNRLAVVGLPALPVSLSDLVDLPNVLGGGRLALGDPAHVPAGIYAKQALQSAGIWEKVAPDLAPASNVRAALRLVQAGAAPVGIVYVSDIRGTNLSLMLEIDPKLHQPIIYVGALAPAQRDGEAAIFLNFLGAGLAQEIALEFGFAENVGS